MVVEDGRLVRIGHRLLPFDGRTVGDMRSTPLELLRSHPAAVRARLQEDSYVLLRSVLPRERVLSACAAMCSVLRQAGWLDDRDTDPFARSVRPDFAEHDLRMNGYSIGGPNVDSREIPDPKTKGQIYGGFHDLQNHPDVRAVLHADELFDVAAALFGEPAGALDYRWMRAVLPNQLVGHGYHMDNVYMGRGSNQLHTFWLPFHDIDLATGGLVVVEGSSQRSGFARLRQTFGMQEQFVTLGQDPAELTASDPAARWVTTNYEAGDLVVFGMHTLHGGVTNSTDAVRLSIDSRFQPLSHAHDPRFPLHPKGKAPPFLATDFIDQQASTAAPIGVHDPELRTLAEALKQWGVDAAPLSLLPDPLNPPPRL